MHRFYAPDIATTMLLPDEEAQHCVRVLRLKEGEEVEVVDGKGHLHLCRILNANAKNCAVEIVGTTDVKPHWGCRITVAIAPTKNMDRMEWMAAHQNRHVALRKAFLHEVAPRDSGVAVGNEPLSVGESLHEVGKRRQVVELRQRSLQRLLHRRHEDFAQAFRLQHLSP